MSSYQEPNGWLRGGFSTPLKINTKGGMSKGFGKNHHPDADDAEDDSTGGLAPSAPISMSLPKVQISIPLSAKKKRNVMFVNRFFFPIFSNN